MTSEDTGLTPLKSKSGGHPEPNLAQDVFGQISQVANKILEPICKYLCYAAAIMTLLMSLAMVVDLVSRLMFNSPLSGMIELQTFMLVFMAFFSIAYTMIKNQHVSVDLITSKMPACVNNIVQAILHIWGTFIFAAMSWLNADRALEAFRRDEISDIIRMPYGYMYAAVTLGTLLMAFVLLTNLLSHLSWLYQNYKQRGAFWIILLGVFILAGCGMFSGLMLKMIAPDLSSPAIGIGYTVFLMVILLLGFPVGFSMAFAGLTGLFYLIGSEVAFNVTKINTYDAVAVYFFVVIPFFLLMGFLILHAGIGAKLYNAGIKVFGRLPGGLAVGTVAGCGGGSPQFVEIVLPRQLQWDRFRFLR
ncbi:MAG: TRAP transporter small permease subunit [Aestuariivita sp.]|nr:TRAP transporter small permease subunit [Aestuariivita sp.]MCY4345904.1 TRAP transporter small permease subunit [Aestuariivita sp.]